MFGVDDLIGGLMTGGLNLAGKAYDNYYNAKEASRNRNWQAQMSSTAYQRAATDLDAAGLNRIIALGSPASTPAGAMATSTGTGEMMGAIPLNSAQSAKTRAEAATAREMPAQVKSQTAANSAKAASDLATASYTRGQEVNNAKELLGKLELMKAQAAAAGASAKQLTELIGQIQAQKDYLRQLTETEKGRTKTETSKGGVYEAGTRVLGPLKDLGEWSGGHIADVLGFLNPFSAQNHLRAQERVERNQQYRNLQMKRRYPNGYPQK